MPQINDTKQKSAAIAREAAAQEASKKKELVKPGANIADQEAALSPNTKAADAAKAAPETAKAPDPKVAAVKDDAAKKPPPEPEKIVEEANERASKGKDFWPAISKLVAAATAATNKRGMKEAQIDEHIKAGRALLAMPELKAQSFNDWCNVRDAVAELEAAKEALKAPPPPEEAVEEVVAKAEDPHAAPEAAIAVAAQAKSLIGGANATQAEKLADAADKAKKVAGPV